MEKGAVRLSDYSTTGIPFPERGYLFKFQLLFVQVVHELSAFYNNFFLGQLVFFLFVRQNVVCNKFKKYIFQRFEEKCIGEVVRELVVQSTLSKADTLGTKATVRFREVSALERVKVQRYKCNSAGSGPNLLSGLERCPV